MTNAQHTPGPWHRDGYNLSAIIRLKFPKGHAECKHIGGTYETIARCDGDNWDANARLIAAAPELLEALQAMVEKHIADHGLLLVGSDHPVGRASIVLNKVKGINQ